MYAQMHMFLQLETKMLTAFVWLTFNQRFLYPTLQKFGDIHSKKYCKQEYIL